MKITIDSIDRRILSELQRDGRISLTDLAERVGLSATPCKRRVARLEESGIISGYHARVDPGASGFGITVFVFVELERQHVDALKGFQRAVAGFAEVVTGTLMTGSQDFVLEVVVESLDEYERFLQNRLLKLEGIRAVRSRFALRKFIDRARIP
ncbi:Lrp/AsnC family transcriptional regulator [Paracoccus sp. SCSIO 75233]|uniref:Lrp/AsnC family transcriptional regulator n=1 Tax=Paracoccus sp. SCSIO 75233 TaxID=3017782 RepID=UPI0022EFF1E7|nr:Lrp/AsnC family transcriptional regulator [Paracoccus sp. SCSIO 75233]WBU52353.1 Lrp/AsnC family transcriptional regulator [Paracoccus sp. SCSIO 75233]